MEADPAKSQENGNINNKLFENLLEVIRYGLGIYRRRLQVAAGGGFKGLERILDQHQPHHPLHQRAEKAGAGKKQGRQRQNSHQDQGGNGNRIGKNSRHPIPKRLNKILHTDPVHRQVAFGTKLEG